MKVKKLSDFPIGSTVKITKYKRKGDQYKGRKLLKGFTIVDFGIVTGHIELVPSIRVELTKGETLNNKAFFEKSVWVPLNHKGLTVKVI